MNKKLIWIILILIVIIVVPVGLFYFTKNSNPIKSSEEDLMNNVQISPEIDGILTKTYLGTFPCADCTGIETTLSLTQKDENNAEGSYVMSQKYLEREDDAIVTSGNWTSEKGDSDPNTIVITLNPTDPEKVEYYLQIDPTQLEKLDNEGNKIDSELNYTLTLQE